MFFWPARWGDVASSSFMNRQIDPPAFSECLAPLFTSCSSESGTFSSVYTTRKPRFFLLVCTDQFVRLLVRDVYAPSLLYVPRNPEHSFRIQNCRQVCRRLHTLSHPVPIDWSDCCFRGIVPTFCSDVLLTRHRSRILLLVRKKRPDVLQPVADPLILLLD